MKLKTKEPAPVEDRPYPLGIAWDEALRQRRRADRLEKAMASVLELTEGHIGYGTLNVIASIAVNVLENQYAK